MSNSSCTSRAPSPTTPTEVLADDDFVRLGNPSHPFRQKHNAHVAHTFVPLPAGTVPVPVNGEWQLINVSKRTSSLAAARHTSLSSTRSMPSMAAAVTGAATAATTPPETRPSPRANLKTRPSLRTTVSEKRRSTPSMSTPSSSHGSPNFSLDKQSTVPSLTMSESTLSSPTVRSLTTDDSHVQPQEVLESPPASPVAACEMPEKSFMDWDDEDTLPHLDVADIMDEAILDTSSGGKITLRELTSLGNKTTVLFFIRHMWCGVCQDYMLASISRLDRKAVEAAGIHVGVVTCGAKWQALDQYRKAMNCEFEMYSDFHKDVYTALGFGFGWLKENSKEARKLPYHQHGIPGQIAHGTMRAMFQIPSGGPKNSSIKQQGGEVIFSPQGEILKLHRMKSSFDHKEAIDVLRDAGLELQPRCLDFNPKSYWNTPKRKEEPDPLPERKGSVASSTSGGSVRRRGLSRMFSISSVRSAGGWNATLVSQQKV